MRFLDYDTDDVTIYTGTVAKYVGQYWIAWRPNWVDKADGSSYSHGFSVRRFLGGRYEYFELSASGGVENEENLITGTDDSLNDFRVAADLRRRVSPKWLVKGTVGYRDQELSFGGRSSYFFGAGFDRFF
jgi:YaiO family outer membrane protein